MISEKAKKIAKEIDRKNKIEEDKNEKKIREYIIEAGFMFSYRICPRCSNKVIESFWRSILSSHKRIFICPKCIIKREYTYYGYF